MLTFDGMFGDKGFDRSDLKEENCENQRGRRHFFSFVSMSWCLCGGGVLRRERLIIFDSESQLREYLD